MAQTKSDTWGSSWGTSWLQSWWRNLTGTPDEVDTFHTVGYFSSPTTIGKFK